MLEDVLSQKKNILANRHEEQRVLILHLEQLQKRMRRQKSEAYLPHHEFRRSHDSYMSAYKPDRKIAELE